MRKISSIVLLILTFCWVYFMLYNILKSPKSNTIEIQDGDSVVIYRNHYK